MMEYAPCTMDLNSPVTFLRRAVWCAETEKDFLAIRREHGSKIGRACRWNIEDGRVYISVLVLYMTITQNATSPLARSRYSPSVKSLGVKYVSGVLFFTRCTPAFWRQRRRRRRRNERTRTKKTKQKTGVLVFLRMLANTSLLPLPLFHAARLRFLRGVTIIIAAELDDRENAAAVTLPFRSRTSPRDASLVTASFLYEISFRFSDASVATHPLRISSSFHRFSPAPRRPGNTWLYSSREIRSPLGFLRTRFIVERVLW